MASPIATLLGADRRTPWVDDGLTNGLINGAPVMGARAFRATRWAPAEGQWTKSKRITPPDAPFLSVANPIRLH